METNNSENGEFRENLPNASVYPKNQSKRFCNGIMTFCNGIAFEHADEKSGTYLIAPFGDHPHGKSIQRIDAACAEVLKRNIASIWARVKNALGNACPVYYEHPDNEDSEVIPTEPDKTPYGKVRSLEVKANGIYANIDWLSGFENLPKHLQISPRWNAKEIAPNSNIFSPSRLLSLGLTRNPVIKSTSFVNSQPKEIEMDKEILILLGYTEDEAQKIIDKAEDAPTDVNERLKKALSKKSTLETESAEKDKQLEVTKTALANSNEALKKSQNHRAQLVIANAVRQGKVTEAQRETAVKILANSEDFEAEAQKFDSAKPAIKTTPQSDGIVKGEKEQQNAKAQIDKLVKEKEQAGMSYNEAWNAVKTEKPDLFKVAFE